MRYPGDHQKFRELLESEHDWPSEYIFKFIVPKGNLHQVEALFPKEEIQFKDSRKGNYVSATIHLHAESPDIIIAVYEQAARIDGLIAL